MAYRKGARDVLYQLLQQVDVVDVLNTLGLMYTQGNVPGLEDVEHKYDYIMNEEERTATIAWDKLRNHEVGLRIQELTLKLGPEYVGL